MEVERRAADIVVVGSGFGGSIMAMVCRRLGRSVVLLERGRHPRFAIGESSTPLANLLLEAIGEQFDLTFLAEFAKWGVWQEKHPNITCGLKRGFTFFHHREGECFRRFRDHRNELLVAASPCAALADTHWYRPDFDAFLARKAVEIGVEYFEESRIVAVEEEAECLKLWVQRPAGMLCLQARFVIDASGPRGALFRLFNLREQAVDGMPPTQGLFAHFRNVRRCEELEAFQLEGTPPYPIDDAAVHHLFPGGWFWVLAFNNGLTSAGVAATDDWAARLDLENLAGGGGFAKKALAWPAILSRFPSLQRAFADAAAVVPFFHQRRVSFLSSAFHSRRWALLPSAAAAVDPLFSTGFPLNLLGIVRLAGMIGRFFEMPEWPACLEQYAQTTRDEACRVGRLVGAAYQAMGCPKLFNAVAGLYFAAVSFEEANRRLRRVPGDNGFLLGSHLSFRDRLDRCLERIRDQLANGSLLPEQQSRLAADIRQTIEPFDVIGISNPEAVNWHPVRLDALFQSAHKLESHTADIREMLARCGIDSTSIPRQNPG